MWTKIKSVYDALSVKTWACFLAGAAMGVIIWTFSSSALQDVIVFGAFLFALFFAERGKLAWKQPAGAAFVILLIYHFITLPFSVSPEMSVNDTVRMLEVLAGAFAIPVVFNTDKKISRAIFYSAVGIALTLAYDLVRMAVYLGPDILAKAHSFRPFILNHSNVASMMAGLSFFVFLYQVPQYLPRLAGGRERASFWPALGCLAGGLVCVAYLFIAASRGPQIAFALAFVFSGLIMPGWRNKLIWLTILVILGAAILVNYKHINPRFAEKKTMAGFSERDRVWKHTWQLVQEKPWFGHGYGKRNFEMNYYASQPPRANYHFPHCHQYWLKLLFEYGWTGLGLYAAAWLILAVSLLHRISTAPTLGDRLLPGAIALMLLFIHLYGLGDYPDNIVQVAQVWLIPAALVALIRPLHQNS
jgi:O-antigen ligase